MQGLGISSTNLGKTQATSVTTSELEALKKSHEALQKSLEALKKSFDERVKANAKEIEKKVNAECDAKIQAMMAACDYRISKIEKQFEEKHQRLKTSYEKKELDLEVQYNFELWRKESAHVQYVTNIKKKHKKQIRQYQEIIKQREQNLPVVSLQEESISQITNSSSDSKKSMAEKIAEKPDGANDEENDDQLEDEERNSICSHITFRFDNDLEWSSPAKPQRRKQKNESARTNEQTKKTNDSSFVQSDQRGKD